MEENKSTFENFELQLTNESKDYLREAGKWAYFLGILGFIGVGLMVLLAFSIGAIFSRFNPYGGMPFPTTLLTVIYLIMAALYFFPVLYLFKFGSKTKMAFATNDTDTLTDGIKNLKSHYKFVGIFTIVIISLYALIFIFALLGSLFR